MLKYRIITSSDKEWPFKIQRYRFGIWWTRVSAVKMEYAEEWIKERITADIDKRRKPVVVKEYSTDDYLVDKLKGSV